MRRGPLRHAAVMARGNDVGHLIFRDIETKGVRNALMISEYYARILPAEDAKPAPVTRLTPHFHDITLENVTATGSASAGAIKSGLLIHAARQEAAIDHQCLAGHERRAI